MYLQKGQLISTDAGHNSKPDKGATGIRQEDDMTKEIVALVNSKLITNGYGVVDCTPYGQSFGNVGQSLEFRVNKANSTNSAFHLCMHFNKFNGQAHGVEVWIDSNAGESSKQFAQQILNEIVAIGFSNRGIKVGNLYIPKHTNAPCVLVEGCFIDNIENMKLYNAEKMADAIVKAIIGVNVTPKVVNKTADFKIHLTGNVQDVGIVSIDGVNSCKIGSEGMSRRLEMFAMSIDGVDFTYQVHQENAGDSQIVGEGNALGSVGMSQRIEGITINVTKIPSEYKLQYRCHIQDIGWTEFYTSGVFCGTKGESKRVESIEVQIIKA